MRSTLMMQTNLATNGVIKNYERIYELQKQITTGRKMNRVSDDPVNAHRALNLRKDMSQNKSFMRAIDNAIPQVRLSQTTLSQMAEQMREAKALAIQAQNSANDDSSIMSNLAARVDSIFTTMLSLGNARNGNTFIFSGYNTTNRSFTHDVANDRVIFDGTDDKIAIPIDNGGITQKISVSGGDVFQTHKVRSSVGFASSTTAISSYVAGIASGTFTLGAGADTALTVNLDPATATLQDVADAINEISGINATAYVEQIGTSYYLQINSNIVGADGELSITDVDNVASADDGLLYALGLADTSGTILGTVVDTPTGGALDTLLKLKDELNNGGGNISTISSYIELIESSLDRISETHATAGTYDIRLEQMKSLKEGLNIDLKALSSSIEDVDFARAATDIAVQQTAYQAAMAIAMKILKLNILPYI